MSKIVTRAAGLVLAGFAAVAIVGQADAANYTRTTTVTQFVQKTVTVTQQAGGWNRGGPVALNRQPLPSRWGHDRFNRFHNVAQNPRPLQPAPPPALSVTLPIGNGFFVFSFR